MNENTEFLTYIYQNAQMGVEAIQQLLPKVEEGAFTRQLQAQQSEYQGIQESATDLLHKANQTEKDLPKVAEVSAHLSIALKTLGDHSSSHIAEMMMQGSTMGIIDVTKNLKRYPGAQDAAKALADRLLKTEKDNMEKLKEFL